MIKIIVHQDIDVDLTSKLVRSLEYMAKMIDLDVDVKVSDGNQFESDSVVIMHLDAANFNSFQANAQLMQSIETHPGSVIVIVENNIFSQLPDCLSGAQVYQYSPLSDNVLAENGKLFAEKSLDVMAHDVVCYLKSVNTKKNDNFTLFIGVPDTEVAHVFQGVLREAEHRNFNIYPSVINPTGKKIIADKQQLWSQLDKCNLAVHFISHQMLERYPKEQGPALQINHLVAEYCNQPGHENLKRIIYLTPEDSNTTPEISRRIAEFKNNDYDMKNAEMVQLPLERLKNILISNYMEWLKPSTVKSNKFEVKSLYFIHPPHKEKNVGDICQWLENHKIEYSKSQVDLDQLDLLLYHKSMMTLCNGVLIYNDGNEQWLKRKISDVVKSPGWGRQSNFKFIIICGEKISAQCSDIIRNDVDYIELTGVMDFERLKEIISD